MLAWHMATADCTAVSLSNHPLNSSHSPASCTELTARPVCVVFSPFELVHVRSMQPCRIGQTRPSNVDYVYAWWYIYIVMLSARNWGAPNPLPKSGVNCTHAHSRPKKKVWGLAGAPRGPLLSGIHWLKTHSTNWYSPALVLIRISCHRTCPPLSISLIRIAF